MDVILNKVIKKKIIKLIKDYTIDGINELVLDFPLSESTFHSIELLETDNDILLHSFDIDFDYPYLFEDFCEDDKLRIYQILKGI
jgi:hypothetical protein